MDDAVRQSRQGLPLPLIRQAALPSVADQVFDALQQRILTLELPPRTRISEAEVAATMGVSRQPVREAFKRLARLGFLQIRPQSSTTVSLISEDAVMRARYIRLALEIQTCRTACDDLAPGGQRVLADLIEAQQAAITAGDRHEFHQLDDRYHQEICEQSGVGYVWDLIQESKAHMDRIRMLTLDTSSQRLALAEHKDILRAITAGDKDAAASAMTNHLSRIAVLVEQMKAEEHTFFTDGAA